MEKSMTENNNAKPGDVIAHECLTVTIEHTTSGEAERLSQTLKYTYLHHCGHTLQREGIIDGKNAFILEFTREVNLSARARMAAGHGAHCNNGRGHHHQRTAGERLYDLGRKALESAGVIKPRRRIND
ncbi:MAG: hypothetical protein WCJ29_05595, partial [bacterium]